MASFLPNCPKNPTVPLHYTHCPPAPALCAGGSTNRFTPVQVIHLTHVYICASPRKINIGREKGLGLF